MKKLTIGLFGFGVVGKGLYDLLIQAEDLNTEIKKICIKDPTKKRGINPSYFTSDPEELINDADIDVIVELIDDTDSALSIVHQSFKAGKPVVSANKKMIAENLPILLEWQEKYKLPLLYEASCCAGIPIIRNLEEYYNNAKLKSIEGIFNGSTNYILSQLFHFDHTFDDVLKDAQEKGFAESNPSLDIDAIDPKYKLGILLLHAFGLVVEPKQIFNFGIRRLNKFDIDFAKKRGKRIRLIAKCSQEDDKVQAWCAPSFVDEGSILSTTENEYNAVLLEGASSDQQFLIGKGAGDTPTGGAVLSDISALGSKYKYAYKKQKNILKETQFDNSNSHKLYVRYQNQSQNLFEDFNSISEKYSGNDANYFVGDIKQSKLQNAHWLNDPEISIIMMN